MTAGLQSDIHCRPGRRLHTVLKCIALRMQVTIFLMPAFPDHCAVIPDNDRADHRIGGHPAASSLCQFQGPAHIFFILQTKSVRCRFIHFPVMNSCRKTRPLFSRSPVSPHSHFQVEKYCTKNCPGLTIYSPGQSFDRTFPVTP